MRYLILLAAMAGALGAQEARIWQADEHGTTSPFRLPGTLISACTGVGQCFHWDLGMASGLGEPSADYTLLAQAADPPNASVLWSPKSSGDSLYIGNAVLMVRDDADGDFSNGVEKPHIVIGDADPVVTIQAENSPVVYAIERYRDEKGVMRLRLVESKR